MGAAIGGNEDDALLVALTDARDDQDAPLARTIAMLWSWLDRHLLTLGSLHEKPPMLRGAAIDAERFPGKVTDRLLEWVSEEPLRNAAELLARIELYFTNRRALLATQVSDIEGNEVLVTWRDPALALMASGWLPDEHDDDEIEPLDLPRPPTSNEHPSLSTLAPRLSVSPVRDHGIELEILPTDSKSWTASRSKMRKALAGPDHDLCVHLDTLGNHGLSSWKIPEEDGKGGGKAVCVVPRPMDDEDEQACIAAARRAVGKARGTGNVLVMPELCASQKILDTLTGELRATHKDKNGPALTVVGRYYSPPTESPVLNSSLVKDAPVAGFVNEAVVLGPDGAQLWCHRKLSAAQGDVGDGRTKSYVEDIVLGTKLALADTPMGMVTVLICLDSFALHVRDRVARSPSEILLVPSLSPKAKRHQTSLHHLVQAIWGAAFVCNRAPDPESKGRQAWDTRENRSFWVLQRSDVEVPKGKRRDTDHPSFVFRLISAIGVAKDAEKKTQQKKEDASDD